MARTTIKTVARRTGTTRRRSTLLPVLGVAVAAGMVGIPAFGVDTSASCEGPQCASSVSESSAGSGTVRDEASTPTGSSTSPKADPATSAPSKPADPAEAPVDGSAPSKDPTASPSPSATSTTLKPPTPTSTTTSTPTPADETIRPNPTDDPTGSTAPPRPTEPTTTAAPHPTRPGHDEPADDDTPANRPRPGDADRPDIVVTRHPRPTRLPVPDDTWTPTENDGTRPVVVAPRRPLPAVTVTASPEQDPATPTTMRAPRRPRPAAPATGKATSTVGVDGATGIIDAAGRPVTVAKPATRRTAVDTRPAMIVGGGLLGVSGLVLWAAVRSRREQEA